ncbi:hypothetical protein CYL18_08230 [Pradoshia eiseniae]|uniref:Flagellar hook-length control protein-like C-terminal domain-containing protein n=1 Tax=Pradoshia eiseniae TaxID=2064768 RepID=A0A2S7N1H8_9BACI|nr:hypothetical protein CYL18_08230 [Pradoshia eiseniae]
MNQYTFSVQKGIPSPPTGGQPFLRPIEGSSSFQGHLKAHLSEKESESESVKGEEVAGWNELADFLKADAWEEVPEALELLALLKDGAMAEVIKPLNLTAIFGEEPGESIEMALRTLGNQLGIDFQDDLRVFPPDEKSMEALISVLLHSLSNSKEIMADGKDQRPLQMVLKWAQLLVLAHEANETEAQSNEGELLIKALERWKEKISSVLPPANQGGNDNLLPQSSAFLQSASHDSMLGLMRGGGQEIPLNQIVLAGELYVKDSQAIVLMKNGQTIETGELMKQLDSIFAKAKFTSINGLQRLQIQLSPENLGTLQIELTKKDGQVLATIVSSTQQGKEILESHLHSLRMTLANQGIQMDRILLQDSKGSFDGQLNDQHHQEEQQERLEDQEDGEFSTFLDELQDLLIDETV